MMNTFLDGLGVVLENEESIRIKVMEETQRLMDATVVDSTSKDHVAEGLYYFISYTLYIISIIKENYLPECPPKNVN